MRKGRRLPLAQLEPYLLPPVANAPSSPSLLDFQALFSNERPVEIEVGFGKGLFLLRSAADRPNVNFVGIEIVRKYQLLTATRLAIRGLPNVRLACADARLFLRDCVPSGSVDTLHIYFPDPWWKTRHHKRRLFTEEFARQVARVLRPGGVLSFASDVEDYARMVRELVATLPELRPLPPPEPGAPAHDMDYLTNFERKFRKEGKAIYRMRWQRVEFESAEQMASPPPVPLPWLS